VTIRAAFLSNFEDRSDGVLTFVLSVGAADPFVAAPFANREDQMHIIWIIIIGFIAGALAKFIMPGKDPGGFLITTALGIVGALIATYLGRLIGWYQEGESAGFIAAVIGAILLLVIYRLFRKKGSA
jgi:uncharacterized membrane protein YeaQ/YmgE (transglycosylase-associated protein family)